MFGKLISRIQGKKSDHPLGSDENLDVLIADIPQADPGRLLLDVDHWLGETELCATDIGAEAVLNALFRLDEFSRAGADELLTRYLSAGKREYMADSIWSAVETHAAQLFEGYKRSLAALPAAKSDSDKARLARCAARALRAWALRKKMQRFRYRSPSAALWLDAHNLLQVLGRMGLQQASVVAYRDEVPTTPFREYLIGLYLEFVPLGNLVPQQLELADRFLRTCEGLELSQQSHPLSTSRIDLATGSGPKPLEEGEAVADSVRYCSVLKLRGSLMKFAALAKKHDAAPPWLTGLPATQEQIASGIVTLMTYWATTPPKRSKDRFDQKVELRVVFGFGLARRMIAASHYARKGRSFKYEGDDIYRLFEESRFGRVTQVGDVAKDVAKDAAQDGATDGVEPEVSSPLEILRKLELRGDLALMETWKQIDESATGFGVVVPAVLPRHRIGIMVCLRHLDGLDWRMGLIRRIGRDAENRPSIGIETLAWPSICAQAKPSGNGVVWAKAVEGGHDWLDAVIASREGKELILPAGAFGAGMEIDVRSEEGLWRLRLESLLERGSDFDRIEFTRIS
jgi:hypothetical protein